MPQTVMLCSVYVRAQDIFKQLFGALVELDRAEEALELAQDHLKIVLHPGCRGY
jgi:hypothetical protein